MSNVLGIIAEYNPFHNGHKYHLEKSKELTNCDYSIAIISGNFTQRGTPSVVDKWKKAEMALSNGIDLVIELPTMYSISSAENFADGAIKILNSLGIVNYLSFGTETDNISDLSKIADILYSEPKKFRQLLSEELRLGLSFPKARENALIKYLDDESYSNLLALPNNILGIEYLKALKKYKSTIKVFALNRTNSNHNDCSVSGTFGSSTAIRKLIKENDFDNIKNLIPNSTYSILENARKNDDLVFDLNVFEKEIIYNLRKMSTDEISNLPDVSEGLEFVIKKAANECNNLEDLIKKIKSKRYTETRINRILLYVLLDITKNQMEISKKTIPYVRVLGFNKNGEKLISEISKKNPKLQLVTSVKKFIDSNTNKNLNLLIEKDILATNVFSLVCKTNFEGNLDFKNNIIKTK